MGVPNLPISADDFRWGADVVDENLVSMAPAPSQGVIPNLPTDARVHNAVVTVPDGCRRALTGPCILDRKSVV